MSKLNFIEFEFNNPEVDKKALGLQFCPRLYTKNMESRKTTISTAIANAQKTYINTYDLSILKGGCEWRPNAQRHLFVLGKDKNEDLRHKYNISKIADSKRAFGAGIGSCHGESGGVGWRAGIST